LFAGGPVSVVIAGKSQHHTACGTVCGLRRRSSAEPDLQLFLRIDRNKSIKMSGKLAEGVARDLQFFSEHPSRGPPCDSVASCYCKRANRQNFHVWKPLSACCTIHEKCTMQCSTINFLECQLHQLG